MGFVVPQVITEDRASGAQIVDGSLKFDGTSQYLTRTPSSVGNRKTFTWSSWVKKSKNQNSDQFWAGVDVNNNWRVRGNNNGEIRLQAYSGGSNIGNEATNAYLRDFSGWYHLVYVVDTTQSTASDRQKIYINGVLQTSLLAETSPSQNTDLYINSTNVHRIGAGELTGVDYYWPGQMSQVYFIDGQALDASYFGYTDLLTNTWRPKKYTGNFNAYPDIDLSATLSGDSLDIVINRQVDKCWIKSGGVWQGGGNPSDPSSEPSFYLLNGETAANLYFFTTGYTTEHTIVIGSSSETGTQPEWVATTGSFSYTATTVSGTPVDSYSSGRTGALLDNTVYAFTFTITTPSNSANHTGFFISDSTSYSSGVPDEQGGNTIGSRFSNGYGGYGGVKVNGSSATINYYGNNGYLTNRGINSFYLPMDGNSPIGEDKSGRGNNWTPVNFGGSVALDNPIVSGALPILNTDGGGKVARPGVFGSEVGAYYAVTVPGGIGGGFYLDGTQKPALSLIRGATYTFDQSDSSNSGHPLVFATTAEGNNYSDGVTTSGTPGSAGAYTKITVPHNAPDTLYYHCSNHSGMGNSTSQTTDTKKADPYAWKNTLALPLVGSNIDVSNQINSGSTTKTITANGNAAASSTQSNFYGGSYYFDGTGDYLGLNASADFGFSTPSGNTNDFTIEWYKYWNSLSGYQTIWSNNYTSTPGILIQTGFNDGRYRVFISNGNPLFQETSAPTVGRWYHYALVRNGTTYTLYRDGVANGSATSSSAAGSGSDAATIGQGNGTYYENGYIQDFRIYKGVAKYTSNFIPASTDPDILPDTPSGVSGSSKLTKIIDGAVAFDGSSSYMRIASPGSDFAFGTGDFTVELFYYTNSSAFQCLIDTRDSGDATNWGFVNNSGTLTWNAPGDTPQQVGGTISTNRWHHLAYSRSGSTGKLFVDGVVTFSGTDSANYDSVANNNATIGQRYNLGSQHLDGFISNFRIIKGTALYTSNFTPPSAPLTNVTNTVFLALQSNTSATDSIVTPGTITSSAAVATNFNPFTTDINTVRGQESGYATLNPLDKLSNVVLTNGNLTCTSGANVEGVRSTIPFPRTGMWYVEYHMDTVTTGGYPVTGIANASKSLSAYAGTGTASVRPVGSARNLGWVIDSTDTPAGYMWTGFALSAGGDTMQIVFNADKGAYYMGVNNSFWGLNSGTAIRVTPQDMLNGTYSAYDVSGDDYFAWAVPYEGKCTLNYGQKPFKFPPPEGFQPLNAANSRPSTVIARPDQYVGIVTYTGTGSTRSVGGLNFSPDLVIIKDRSTTNNVLWSDTVRRPGRRLISNLTIADATDTDRLSAFTSDGFTVGNAPDTNDNSSSNYYVGWAWKAGGGARTLGVATSFYIDDVDYGSAAAAGLDGGSVNPTGASVGTEQGFSIIKWNPTPSTVHTVSHGLGKIPKFMILKQVNASSEWSIYHEAIGATKRLRFTTDASASSTVFGNTAPTDTVFTNNITSSSNIEAIAYLWADVPGLQKFGSYIGTATAEGPYIHLGFRPKVIITKAYGTTSSWGIWDTERDLYNPTDATLYPQSSGGEETSGAYPFDILSNGFKVRNSANFINATSGVIYAAWAEAPTFNLYGAQSNAR